MGQKTKIG